MDVEKIKPLLRAVVQSTKGGIPAYRFNREFRGIMGQDIPFRKLNFPSLDAFIETIPDTIRIGRGPDGDLTYFAVADASTVHIQRMVAAQKSTKRKCKPTKVYMRKPAYKASWSTRASPGVRAPQRPQAFTRPTAAPRPQPHGLMSHTTPNSTVHRPMHNAVSHMYRNTANTNVHARNSDSLAMRNSLATTRPAQNAQMMNRNIRPATNNGCAPYPSQNNHSTNNNGCAPYPSQKNQSVSNDCAPYPSQKNQSTSSNDCAPFPSQKTQSISNNDCAPYPSQKTQSLSNDCEPYPSQKIQSTNSNDCAPFPSQKTQSTSNNDCAPYPSQNKRSLSNNPTRPSQNTESQSVRANVAAYRPAQNIQTNTSSWDSEDVQPTDDAAHKAKSELLRQYAAPQPQPQCHGKADFLRRVPSSAGNSTGSSGNSRASSNNSTESLNTEDLTSMVVGRVTKSRAFNMAISDATSECSAASPLLAKRVNNTDAGELTRTFDQMNIYTSTSSRICEKVTDSGSHSTGLKITISQEEVPTEITKYGKTYKVAPRFQRLEKQRIADDSDVQIVLDDDSPKASSAVSKQSRDDRVSLPATERRMSNSTAETTVKQGVSLPATERKVSNKTAETIVKQGAGDMSYKYTLECYLKKNDLPIQYETTSIGRSTNPAKFVSSIEIKGNIFGSMSVFPTALEAEERVALNACQQLSIKEPKVETTSKPEARKKSVTEKADTTTVTSDPYMDKVKTRVKAISLKHMSGLWSIQLPNEYRDTYWEEPPANILALIEDWPDIVKVERMSGSTRKIVYPYTEPIVRLVQKSKMDHFTVQPAAMPVPGASLTVLISHLVDCSHFYVQCADSTINEIMGELADIYEVRGSPKPLLDAKPDQFCVTKYEDGNWYRTRILAVYDSEADGVVCDVMYIDFGNCDTVPASRICRILESTCKEPAQAIPCSLQDVFPLEGDTFSEDAINFFYNLSMDTELKMNVIKTDETTCSVILSEHATAMSINRHLVLDEVVASMDPPPLQLPENNDWPVLVTFVKMTTEVTIRLVGAKYSDKLEDLEEKLSSLADMKLTEAHVDGVYAACIVDAEGASWSRVRILRIKERECEVLFLDHGDTDTVIRDALRPLSREMNQLPYQAVLCKLTGLEAYEKDQKVIDCLAEISLGKTCIAAVDDRLDKVSLTLWDTSSTEDVNINETAAKVLKTEDLTPKLPERGGTIEVYVSCVTQQGDIYIQCQGPGLQQLEKVADHIEEQYGKAGSASAFVSMPQVGQLCIAKNSDSGNWYRAEVMKLLPDRMVEVRFVDHGIVDDIHYRYLRDLPTGSSLRDLPYQAIKCRLCDLPPVGAEWTVAALDRLVELMPADGLRVLEVMMGALDTEERQELALVEVYEIAKDGELMPVSVTATAEEELWAENDVFEDESELFDIDVTVG